MTTNVLEKSQKNLLHFLQNVGGQVFDICDVLFQMITASDPSQQADLFQFVCELFGTVKSTEATIAPISEYSSQKDRLEEQYGDIVNSLIKTLGRQNEEESVFYRSLWTVLNESLLFDSTAKKVFAFYYVLVDKRIPYFKISEELLYSMSNEHFSELQQKTARESQKIRFILKADISQKTERAAILLHELGITIPPESEPQKLEEYEKHLMQMVYILREQESDRLSSLLSKIQK